MQTLVEVDGILASDDLVLAALALVHHREFPVQTRRSVCACVSRDGFFFAPCRDPKYPEERDDSTAVRFRLISTSLPSTYHPSGDHST
jgi:hypothetical protein